VNGEDQCLSGDGGLPPPIDPCRFTTCGAGGECFLVDAPDGGATGTVAACACVPGATARTTFDPSGTATVVCQDRRMSFLNPGDVGTDGTRLPDPCAGFECGLGRCEAVNLTPTCICDRGAVAVASLGEDGTRRTTCQAPKNAVPAAFYTRRLPALPAALPGGRVIDMPDEPRSSRSRGGGLCTVGNTGAPSGPGAASWASLALAAALARWRRRARAS
jgi:hypothetical protein